MTFWVAQKKSLYSLIATEHCMHQLRKEGVTTVVTETTWQDIERDLPHLAPVIADELMALRQADLIRVLHPSTDQVRSIIQQTHGELSIRLSSLCALARLAEGTLLLTDSVQLIRTLTRIPVCSFSTGITVARRWLDSNSCLPSPVNYVESAGKLLMLTPEHPEADWWFSHLCQ